MNSRHTTARTAGVLYLLLAITGFFALMYVPRTFVVSGDAAATARNIVEAESLYRLGVLSELVSNILFLSLVLVLYRLLADVHRHVAMVMVILVSVSVAIGVTNAVTLMAPLTLVSGAEFLSAFTRPQLDALTLGVLRLHTNGLQLNEAFWGLWLFPFGLLVIKSGFFPRILGLLLMVAGVAYLAGSFTSIVAPTPPSLLSLLVTVLGSVGEGAMILWLLIKGAKASATGEGLRAAS